MSDTPDGNFDDLWPEFLRIGLEVGHSKTALKRIWDHPGRELSLKFHGFQPKAMRAGLTASLLKKKKGILNPYTPYSDFTEPRER